MKKKSIDKDVIFLLISAVITVATWIGFEVYRAYTKVVIPEGVEKHLSEIDPKLEEQVLEGLSRRRE